MASNQFVLAYACDREDDMSLEELQCRLDAVTEHMSSIVRGEIERFDVGDGRSGMAAWQHASSDCDWPSLAVQEQEAAAWLHIPSVAGGRDSGVDAVRLAREFTSGSRDRADMGAPCAALHWSEAGLRIANDRLGMVRLYEFPVPGFGYVWSSRPSLAHIFGGLVPQVEQSSWNDMATLGWIANGRAHLGNGHHMAASTTVRVDRRGRTKFASDRDQWIVESREGVVPSLADAAQGMVDALAVATRWPGKTVADLSGGKDSRVTAAAAIRAGVVSAVRTVNTDTGEVDTARELLQLAGHPVEHRVDAVPEPKEPEGGVLNRYLTIQRAWDGTYNARSAYRTPRFKGFTAASAPWINGLGGEAIQGRTTVSPAWRAKLEGQGPEAGRARLAQMVRTGAAGVTEDGIVDTLSAIDDFTEAALRLGMSDAFMVVDYFYHFSKMPFWSMPQSSSNTLLPFYSPNLLPRTMWSLKNPASEYGRFHRELLRDLMPVWAEVPFYKGSVKTRGTPWMWGNGDWAELSSAVLDGVGSLVTFSPTLVHQFVEEANAGDGNVRHELALTRVMWELSFREYAKEIGQAAERTARNVERIRDANRGQRRRPGLFATVRRYLKRS